MSDRRLGDSMRAARRQLGLTQAEVAAQAGVARARVVNVEAGLLEARSVGAIRAIASVLGGSVALEFRWRGPELPRLLNAGHSAMHEALAHRFAELPAWQSAAEVTFSRWGERGVIDRLAFHAEHRVVLVIELKTQLVDLEDLLATMDRRARLAREIAAERGWHAERVARWVVLADTPTNRRHLARHAAVLRSAFPQDGRTMRGWLQDPVGVVSALGFLSIVTPDGQRGGSTGVRGRGSGRIPGRASSPVRRPRPPRPSEPG